MADGFIVRRGGRESQRVETPTINFVSSTTTSITFTIKNNDAEDATIVYRVDSLTADGESISVAAGVTSGNQTISDLTEGDLITIFATANVEGKVKSNVAELERGTTLATPTITQVSKDDSSITFTVRNESKTATDVTYGLTSPPTTTTLALAAETTSSNQTISGLAEDTLFTVFAQAKKTNHTDSAIAESAVTTDAPFSPGDLSPQLWLDASDSSTITESSGSVSQWNNKGSLGNFTQGTGASQPTTNASTLNSLNVIDFAVGDFLIAANQNEWTFMHNGTVYEVFSVLKFGTTANPNTFLGLLGNDGGSGTKTGANINMEDRSEKIGRAHV
jgi:hypothetical protein